MKQKFLSVFIIVLTLLALTFSSLGIRTAPAIGPGTDGDHIDEGALSNSVPL